LDGEVVFSHSTLEVLVVLHPRELNNSNRRIWIVRNYGSGSKSGDCCEIGS
jgi:hypothetical protein